ncbi:alpha/beta fold hydrolase [Microbacterium sp. EST19A]|uniref:alpha/beta fold hydrolase n=1 Tax=Microbacterium sp. EST19A TaxID=2862681 RepID=UPI001CBD80A1|nr:alpha/beta hydrolase [Microbacterium sp. EST19A]
MSTFALIHGGGDVGWSWHLVAAELEAQGHDVIAPDLPADDDALTLEDYADAVVAAVGDRKDVVVVGHSFGGFTAPLVAERLSADALVLLAGMIPAPGEPPEQWWSVTGYGSAVEVQSARDGGLTGHDDPYVSFYNGVPRELAAAALSKERQHPSSAAMSAPWPLAEWPAVPTRFIVCADDRFFPADFLRDLAQQRLGIVADEVPGGHCAMLSHPGEIAALLVDYAEDCS